MITGQLLFRDMGADTHSNKAGHRMMMVLGILSVPESPLYKDGHQYTVVGSAGQLNMIGGSIDRKEEIRGNTASGILTLPIWRV